MRHLLPTLLACALASGCANSPTPRYDAKFGAAVREARLLQTLNPTPAPDTAAGYDGKAARESVNRYHDSFKSPPPVTNVINIGGSLGSGGK